MSDKELPEFGSTPAGSALFSSLICPDTVKENDRELQIFEWSEKKNTSGACEVKVLLLSGCRSF